MKKIPYALTLSALLLASAARAEEIQPGNWNVDVSLSMGGVPMPANTQKICLKDVNQLVNDGADCSVKTTSAAGNRVKMDISCKVSGMQMDGTGDLIVSPTKADGTLNLAMQMGQGPAVQTVTTLHAVRLGDCQPKAN